MRPPQVFSFKGGGRMIQPQSIAEETAMGSQALAAGSPQDGFDAMAPVAEGAGQQHGAYLQQPAAPALLPLQLPAPQGAYGSGPGSGDGVPPAHALLMQQAAQAQAQLAASYGHGFEGGGVPLPYVSPSDVAAQVLLAHQMQQQLAAQQFSSAAGAAAATAMAGGGAGGPLAGVMPHRMQGLPPVAGAYPGALYGAAAPFGLPYAMLSMMPPPPPPGAFMGGAGAGLDGGMADSAFYAAYYHRMGQLQQAAALQAAAASEAPGMHGYGGGGHAGMGHSGGGYTRGGSKGGGHGEPQTRGGNMRHSDRGRRGSDRGSDRGGGGGGGGGGTLLEDFKLNRVWGLELRDIAGQALTFATDQHGSRFIQQKLESASVEEMAALLEEILPAAFSLCVDVFGNYVVQKALEFGPPAARRALCGQLEGRVLSLTLQMYGCRVIQKALEVVEPDLQAALVAELEGHELACVKDQNGNHVIQKCIEHVPAARKRIVANSFAGQARCGQRPPALHARTGR